ncbi:ATP-binding protein [Terribacillus sp. DMT04]|uniref:ATP-binding protein n=1 Tax=Terribacillus sp. DMT04 TaxID=2850441 RepID=UPI0020B71FCA|nr:ATP-binding protein [Terribacillus sp. DMT04]
MKEDDYNREKQKQAASFNLMSFDGRTFAGLPKPMLKWIDENGFDIVFVCDEEGMIQYTSTSITRMLGYLPEEVYGTSSLAYLDPCDVPVLRNRINSTTEWPQRFHLTALDNRGKHIWMEASISFVETPEASYYIGVAKDVSDKKEIEEMMFRSEKMSVAGQLAAGIAHEIRNPLTSLKGFLQLIQAGISRKEEYYKIMVEEIEKIETITSELLFISKPVAENKETETIHEMLQDVITLLYSQARLQNVQITFEKGQNSSLLCDRSQIKQLFINLIKNALEEMPNGGKIDIRQRQADGVCIVDVVDEGPGIPDNVLEKLKEPFFTTKKEGTGLGLMICTQILEKHNGRLDILRNETLGSTFSVFLPVMN